MCVFVTGPGHAEHKSMNRIILGELGQKASERLQEASSRAFPACANRVLGFLFRVL